VALKVLKPGMDTRQVIARFEAERQALAIMDHPNIARVFDGGATPTGRPYFVMEFVKGVPITQFCDEQTLSPRERLELFIPVCQAIQHAHQKGVIHRDLKPTNILVSRHDTTPVVKVIDFGVAKALGQELTDKTLFTGVAQIIGTPLYMSPEQAGMSDLDVDTRSDIYSLGVLLYELLTGSTPFAKEKFKKAAYDEIRRIIRDEEPPKPGTRLSESKDALPLISAQRQTEPAKLTKLVRGDLDWIVMKCLEKDRNRRYETANGVAKDIERYLADEPVLACPPSAGYRLKKFAHRNRGRLMAAAVLGAALLVAVGAAAWSVGWVARDHAARQARLSGQVELILDDVNRLETEQKWRDAQAAVERAEAVLAGGDSTDVIQQRVREVRRDLAFVAELDHIRQASATAIERKATDAGSAQSYVWAKAAHDYRSAFREYAVDVESLPKAEAVAQLQRKPSLVSPIVASLDDWVAVQRSLDESNPRWKALVAIARELDRDPLQDRFRAAWGRPMTADLPAELQRLAESLDVTTQPPATLRALALTFERVRLADAALQLLERSQDAHPNDFFLNLALANLYYQRQEYAKAHAYLSVAVALRPDSSMARNNLGLVLGDQGEVDEAIACLQKAIELDPRDGSAYCNLGIALHGQKKLDEAVACYRKAIDIDPNDPIARHNLGNALLDERKLDEAVACFRKAIELEPRAAASYTNLGAALCDQDKLDEAVACHRKSIDLNPKDANAYNNLGNALRKQKKPEETIAAYRKAVELNPKQALIRTNLGHVLRDQKRIDEASVCYRSAIQLDPKAAAAYEGLGQCLYAEKQFDEANGCYQQASRLDPNNVGYRCGLGSVLIAQKKLEEAVACCRQAVAIAPNDAKAYAVLGEALFHQNKLDEASAALRQAIALDSKLSNAHYNLGRASYNQGKTEEAMASFRKAIELDPQSSGVHFALGVALQYRQKKLDEAIASYRKAVEADPKRGDYYLALGAALDFGQNNFDEAAVCYRKAVELDPHSAYALFSLGHALLRQKKLNEAIANLREAVAIDQTNALAYDDLGIALQRQRKSDQAVPWFEKAIKLNPKDCVAHFNLGIALLDQGNRQAIEAATGCFEKVIELDPKNADAHNDLGWALLSLGKLDEAIPELSKAIELNPNVENAHINLGLVYFRQKKLDESVTWFRKAIGLRPKDANAHHDLGLALHAQGKLEEAITENRNAVLLDPKYAPARGWLVDTLAPLGRLEELRAAWEQALAGNPPEHDAWFGYAELCLFMNNEDAYRGNRTALLQRFAKTTSPAMAERTARACLLLPATGEELKQAVALADRAVESGKNSSNFRYYAIAKALAEYRLDHYQSAIEWAQTPGAQDTCPTLLILAMAHQRLGHTEQARQFFDEAIKTYEWKTVNNEWGGISHSLRREAESLLNVESGVREPVSDMRRK
jgi:tetratricopeptide (TPR) repeat protein